MPRSTVTVYVSEHDAKIARDVANDARDVAHAAWLRALAACVAADDAADAVRAADAAHRVARALARATHHETLAHVGERAACADGLTPARVARYRRAVIRHADAADRAAIDAVRAAPRP